MWKVDVVQQMAFYRAALTALRYVDTRRSSQRRFGVDADALWNSFRGDLTAADRIELLLRDADVEWPGAFGARIVFQLPGVAEDDPFGIDWPELNAVKAAALWKDIASAAPPADGSTALRAAACAWGLKKLSTIAVDGVTPRTNVVVAGASAIAATAAAFESASGLSWPDQVTIAANQPANRQLGLLAAATLNTNPAPVLEVPGAKAKGIDQIVSSEDADPEVLSWLRGLGGDA